MSDIFLYNAQCKLTPPTDNQWATWIPGWYTMTAGNSNLLEAQCHVSVWITDKKRTEERNHQEWDSQKAIWVCSWMIAETPVTILSILGWWHKERLWGKGIVLSREKCLEWFWDNISEKLITDKEAIKEDFRKLDVFSDHMHMSQNINGMQVIAWIWEDFQLLVLDIWGKIYRLI